MKDDWSNPLNARSLITIFLQHLNLIIYHNLSYATLGNESRHHLIKRLIKMSTNIKSDVAGSHLK
jgi:hypothetical protein